MGIKKRISVKIYVKFNYFQLIVPNLLLLRLNFLCKKQLFCCLVLKSDY